MTLYHGTRQAFGKGGWVLPGSQVGQDNTTDAEHFTPGLTPYRGDRVYVTTDLDLAKTFARLAKGRGRPKVFEVLYTGLIERDDATYDGEDRDDCYKVEGARVVRRVWIDTPGKDSRNL